MAAGAGRRRKLQKAIFSRERGETEPLESRQNARLASREGEREISGLDDE